METTSPNAKLTVPQLIDLVLESCASFERYAGDLGKLRFYRDQNSLIKAVARFGHECHKRGWEFTADEIVDPILGVIRSLRGREEEIKTYLPRYLECAIDRHVRLKADDYSAKAKAKRTSAFIVKQTVQSVQPVAVIREPSHTELLAAAYGDKRSTIKTNLRKAKEAKPQDLQQTLL